MDAAGIRSGLGLGHSKCEAKASISHTPNETPSLLFTTAPRDEGRAYEVHEQYVTSGIAGSTEKLRDQCRIEHLTITTTVLRRQAMTQNAGIGHRRVERLGKAWILFELPCMFFRAVLRAKLSHLFSQCDLILRIVEIHASALSIFAMSTKSASTENRFGGLQGATLFWIQRIDQAVRHKILAGFRSRGHSISGPQWEILSILWQRDGLTQTKLAAATASDKASVTRILDRMARDGLVERRPDPNDRRAFRIHLKEAGRQLHTQLLPDVQRIIESAFSGIDEEQQRAANGFLKQVYKNLKVD